MDPVELPVPPSVNSIWRVARYVSNSRPAVTLSKAYKLWRDEAVLTLRLKMQRVKVYPVAVRVVIIRGKGWLRGRDCDNVLKPLIDALVKAERIADDSEDYVASVCVRIGPEMARACVMVTVEPAEATDGDA